MGGEGAASGGSTGMQPCVLVRITNIHALRTPTTKTCTHTLLGPAQHCVASLSPSGRYRANPNYLRNPKFCVGCFEFYLSKILRQHLKQGGKYYFFAIFFCGTHFCGAY